MVTVPSPSGFDPDAQHPNVFDPLLGLIAEPPGQAGEYAYGYQHWPSLQRAQTARLKLMVLGNSTSVWTDHCWSLHLGEALAARGLDVGIFNGASPGATSAHELLRILRDAPGIRPDVIVSLSGICDLGNIVYARNYPFLHKYQREIIKRLKADHGVTETNAGVPDPGSPVEVWHRHQRLMHCTATQSAARHIAFLQPTMGIGRYQPTEASAARFAVKREVVLLAYNRPYHQGVTDFFEPARRLCREAGGEPWLIDLVDTFADAHDVYADHRHYNATGHAIIAAAVLAELERAGLVEAG